MQPTNLSSCQKRAYEALFNSKENIFLTGGAGTGKSYLIQEFLKHQNPKTCPIVASTGAAAILVGGRTFHSFFGIGILEGGVSETVNRAIGRKTVVKRLKQCTTVIIDEISMIPSQALLAADWICKKARNNTSPWGGIRVIAVGDFFQLPPVSRGRENKDWAFLTETWDHSQFNIVNLTEIKRTSDAELTYALSEIRKGSIPYSISQYFEKKVTADDDTFMGTRLFPRRESAEQFNDKRLSDLKGKTSVFETEYFAIDPAHLEKIKKDAPLPQQLRVKKGALVMLRNNDPEQNWVNGSLGTLSQITEDMLTIELLSGKTIRIGTARFEQLDADGKVIRSASNFPINLAYATTIHKAQGMTLDQVRVDLRGTWEHGQAYVALSRARSGKGIFLSNWSPNSIILDREVIEFSERYGIE